MTRLARSNKITIPNGGTVQTPLLVPSFSSKGFGVDAEGRSEISTIFEVASEYIADTMLISAYDLYYEHLPSVGDSVVTELTFLDSGGYEVSNQQDMSAVYVQSISPHEWTPGLYEKVLSSWPDHVPAVFVSFDRPDRRVSLAQQVAEARKLFNCYPGHLTSLLIKPETEDQRFVQHRNVIAHADTLRDFDFIGLTEKELGNSVLQRMERIALIRQAFDDVENDTPIHIFGSFDPLTSALYFLSGAEVFDGLSWLRYGFADGVACYQQNYAIKNIGIRERDELVRAMTIRNNLSFTRRLESQMRAYLLEGDFGSFGENGPILQQHFTELRTKNKRAA